MDLQLGTLGKVANWSPRPKKEPGHGPKTFFLGGEEVGECRVLDF